MFCGGPNVSFRQKGPCSSAPLTGPVKHWLHPSLVLHWFLCTGSAEWHDVPEALGMGIRSKGMVPAASRALSPRPFTCPGSGPGWALSKGTAAGQRMYYQKRRFHLNNLRTDAPQPGEVTQTQVPRAGASLPREEWALPSSAIFVRRAARHVLSPCLGRLGAAVGAVVGLQQDPRQLRNLAHVEMNSST